MDKNVGGIDRTGRIVIGPVLTIAGIAALTGYWAIGAVTGVIAIAVAAVLLVTGTTQKCPINEAVGVDTTPEGHRVTTARRAQASTAPSDCPTLRSRTSRSSVHLLPSERSRNELASVERERWSSSPLSNRFDSDERALAVALVDRFETVDFRRPLVDRLDELEVGEPAPSSSSMSSSVETNFASR